MNAIDSIEVPARALADPLRIPILKFYKMKGIGAD
jgi:translation elongation factor EF-1alpha